MYPKCTQPLVTRLKPIHLGWLNNRCCSLRQSHDARTTFQSWCVSCANISYLVWQPTFFHTSGSHLTRCRQFRATSLENQQSCPVWFQCHGETSACLIPSCPPVFHLVFLALEKKNLGPAQHCTVCYKTKKKTTFHSCRILMKVILKWRVSGSVLYLIHVETLIHISVDFCRTAAITLPSLMYLSEMCIPVYLLLNHTWLCVWLRLQ